MQPVIKVSEISAILIRLKKRYIKVARRSKEFEPCGFKLATIQEVRKALELRRRSREGVNVNRPIRNKNKK